MSTKYKATIPGKAYFITLTTINWVDLFKRLSQRMLIVNALNYCVEKESRRDWLLELFQESCAHLKRNQTYKVWQNGYHAEYIESEKLTFQKLNYPHNHLVVDKIV